jgi:MFS family permease
MLPSEVSTVAEQRRKARTAASSGFFGTTLEFYDFVVYGTAAALFFGPVFFPDRSLGTVLALGTFGVAYVARPFGAILWGHLGDRIGRKQTLLTIILTMGVATFLVGCLPSYASIGVAAPVLLVVLRLVQGISAGGEQAGSALLALEHAPERYRGFYTSWTIGGANFGSFLASVVFLPLTALLSAEQMLSFGWRIPFWISAVVFVVTYVLRRRLTEPVALEQLRRDRLTATVPLVEVFRQDWRTVLRLVLVAFSISIHSLFAVFGLSYATTTMHLDSSAMLVLIAGVNLLTIATQPLFAILSDRIGRKPVFLVGLIGAGALMPVWLGAVHAGNWLGIYLVGFLMMCGFWAMVTAIIVGTFLEMYPPQVRYTGAAVSHMLGNVLSGFIPLIAASFVRADPDNWGPVGWLAGGIALVSALAVLAGPETSRTRTADLGRSRSGDAATAGG